MSTNPKPVLVSQQPEAQLHLERHFDVQELATQWGVSDWLIRKWFRDEPGVLRITIGNQRGREHKVFLRIPESTAARVYRKHSRVDV
jgi:hypothetical protein